MKVPFRPSFFFFFFFFFFFCLFLFSVQMVNAPGFIFYIKLLRANLRQHTLLARVRQKFDAYSALLKANLTIAHFYSLHCNTEELFLFGQSSSFYQSLRLGHLEHLILYNSLCFSTSNCLYSIRNLSGLSQKSCALLGEVF